MKQNMGIFIINKRPKKYLTQGLRYCGGYTIKAILSAYNLDTKGHPKEYLPKNEQLRGATYDHSMQKILEKYGLKAPILHAKEHSNEEKIKQLKKHLRTNNPVIMTISNGYNSSGKYSKLRSYFIGHWISLWGFDENKKLFFAYDSYRNPKYWNKVPIGNVSFTYENLLRDWKARFWGEWRDFLWIPVSKK